MKKPPPAAIRAVLNAAGVIFIDEKGDGPGRQAPKKARALRRWRHSPTAWRTRQNDRGRAETRQNFSRFFRF
jgi:hypothetical protein